jgi:hypothetical protein
MSNGICLIAQNNSTTNYVKQAYALALSILAKSPNTNISLITDDNVPYDIFDKIIPIPWSDRANNTDWKIENRWKVYHVTPYRNTVVFDVDMLVLDNIDYVWNNCHELVFTNSVKTYRNEVITNRYYRKTFDSNNLPDVYVGMYQFSKCENTHRFFVLLDIIMSNWKVFYKKYAPKSFQNWCSVDVSVAIALKILGIEGETLHKDSLLSFTHMKPKVQNLNSPPTKWTNKLPVDIGKSGIIINGYKQSGVLHYVEDEFLTDDIVKWLEEQV